MNSQRKMMGSRNINEKIKIGWLIYTSIFGLLSNSLLQVKRFIAVMVQYRGCSYQFFYELLDSCFVT
ncbi:MAG: hypothetical protein P8I80_07985 [Bacteroidales bacterium]|nr:hypothetical protein [Bacteroidales bacterium]MDG2081458.1 hypothetical protein [Bacteroidales bacterium]